ncbi:hypothetical protein APSETT444_007847 [Aspergillus pseudonomiae]
MPFVKETSIYIGLLHDRYMGCRGTDPDDRMSKVNEKAAQENREFDRTALRLLLESVGQRVPPSWSVGSRNVRDLVDTSYMVGSFKLNHREVYGIDDAAGLMFGPVGREVLGAGFILYLTFVAASGILGISIALNAISTHGACTAIFVAVAAIGVFCLAIIRTLSRVTILAWGGLACILIAMVRLLDSVI